MLKVFSISNINIENSEVILIGNFTTIRVVGAVVKGSFGTLLSNNYPKECQQAIFIGKMKVSN